MNKHKVLIVDDEPDIRELLEITLGRMNIETKSAKDLQLAKHLLDTDVFDLCLTDMRLPDGNGVELVSLIQTQYPEMPVAVITAFGNMDTAITALKAGAFDFVSKPVDLQNLRDLVTTALKLNHSSDTSKITPQNEPSAILGQSQAIQTLIRQIHKLARSQAPVYISGESGSGKELVAKEIHLLGARSDQPFIPVNCGAIPSELMESEFFGHLKGSFTGAHDNKQGLFQAANGGTLFLDEVADLPLNMQVKLLRAIQEKAIRPVGSQEEIPVDVRVLSATHKNLEEEVNQGRFRQDLFYRINVIQLAVPPLRERKQDIPILIDHILKKLAMQWHANTPHLHHDAEKIMLAHSFPGNVRELENILERAFTLCDDNIIHAEHLQLTNQTNTQARSSAHENTENFDVKEFNQGMSLEQHLTEIEKQEILKALETTHWNRTAAAKKLGMSFRALRYRLKKLGLDSEGEQ
ncbi:MAG TPA: sigma-54 dependent transcriptional regulator [Pseudomonadales bacterium]